jgi:hypothetical protein
VDGTEEGLEVRSDQVAAFDGSRFETIVEGAIASPALLGGDKDQAERLRREIVRFYVGGGEHEEGQEEEEAKADHQLFFLAKFVEVHAIKKVLKTAKNLYFKCSVFAKLY